mgnify:CR=1 FL=1
MPRLNLKVVGNRCTQMWLTAAHAMRGKPPCHLRVRLKISYVFKFKISITLLNYSICLLTGYEIQSESKDKQIFRNGMCYF